MAAAGALIAGYLLFVLARLGLHQRLPLALGPISLDTIPDRAAATHGANGGSPRSEGFSGTSAGR